MARRRSHYLNGKTRGGIKGVKVDTSFGAPGNRRKSAHDYSKNDRSKRTD